MELDNELNNQSLNKITDEVISKFKLLLIHEGFPNRNSIQQINANITKDGLDINIPLSIIYWDKGRKPFSKKIPLNVLIKWMNTVGIKGGINTAFAIQTAIYTNGIKPHNKLTDILESINNLIDNDLTNIINKQIETNLYGNK